MLFSGRQPACRTANQPLVGCVAITLILGGLCYRQQVSSCAGQGNYPIAPLRQTARYGQVVGIGPGRSQSPAIRADVRLRTDKEPSRLPVPVGGLRGTKNDTRQGAEGNRPVTLSTGSRPAVPLLKCDIPSATASSLAARSTTGWRARRVSVFLWESPETMFTMGSTINRLTFPIRAVSCSRAAHVTRRIEWARFLRQDVAHEINPLRLSAHRDQTRKQRIARIILAAPDQHIPQPPRVVPSGQRPPAVMVAATASAIVVFPAPGAPAIDVLNFPRASHSFQSHRIGSGFRARSTNQRNCSAVRIRHFRHCRSYPSETRCSPRPVH